MKSSGHAPKENPPNTLILGYDLDAWQLGKKAPISVDISPATNSHMLICGMSGSGKSYFEQTMFAKLAMATPGGEFHFADYKGEDAFNYLRECPRYYPYKNSLEALDLVHSRLNARMSGEDTSTNQITVFWDEYMANILALTNEDKKKAATVMNMVSEILLMGRSKSVRFVCSLQRPDAIAFPAGSRLNYGILVILGAAIRSIYEMLLPDFIDKVKGRIFGRGEGVVLLQGSKLHFIKVPTVRDEDKMRELCVNALK